MYDQTFDLNDQIFTKIKKVKIADIIADEDMQQRAESYDDIISEYEKILLRGGELAPLKVVRDKDKKYWLWDGFHTLEAAKRAGQEKIKVEISRGTRRDAWKKSLGANEAHGIRRSKADRQKAIDSALNDPEIKMSLLEEDGEHSFRSIAKLCAVGHPTISRRWNNFHYPKILRGIDEAVKQEPLPGLMSNKEWFADIAQELSVPAWLVEERYVQSRVFAAEEDEASEAELTGGTRSTHQTVNARIIGPVEEEEVSDAELTGGTRSTHQTVSARIMEPEKEASDAELTGGTRSTHQTVSARYVEPSAEIINVSQPVPTVVVWPSNVIIYDPARQQLYDGDKSSNILVNYATQQHGVRVVAAQRPSEGWTKETNKGISQALAQVTNQGTENVKSVLIMIVKD